VYEQYLIRLLAPLSLYNLRAPHNGGELAALGGELDSVSGLVELVERESLLATAESEGLDRREVLFAHKPAAVTQEDRREAIAALLLGAKDAFACDIDDKCVGVAYENAALNGVGKEHYTVRAGDVLSDKRLQKEFGGDYDVIVANIVADVIIALAPQVGKLLKKGGIFLCSGIIDDRAEEVREKLVEAGWTIEETRSSEGWFSYLCR
jgi:hypothetical protein